MALFRRRSVGITGSTDYVIKTAGKSLVNDTDIAKIHSLHADDQELSGLQPKEIGKGLSTNDFTTELKSSYDNAVSHAILTHAPLDSVNLAMVKSDSDISSAIALKHSNTSDHTHSNKSTLDNLTAQTWKSGITTKNINDTGIVQNIAHGLGRVPKFVRIEGAIIISAAITQMCTGVFDGTNNNGLSVCIGEGTSTAATDAVYTSTSIALGFSPLVATNVFTGANRQTGVISVDDTNIKITWTKTGTVASLTASLLWQCT